MVTQCFSVKLAQTTLGLQFKGLSYLVYLNINYLVIKAYTVYWLS